MGLDVYVGPLTRYMAGDWETVIQRWARETGQDLQVVRATPEPEDAITDPDVLVEVVTGWRDAIAKGIDRPLGWDERADAPYFTDKPDWDSYGSVQVLAALVELGRSERPGERVTDWTTEAAWQEASQVAQPRYQHLYFPEMWLPADLPVIEAEAPWGQQIVIGSSQQLLDVLEEVNGETYRVRPEDRRDLAPSEGPFDDAARFGLAILLALARQSVDHRLPLKLDY
jgi:hypothetical protein